MGRRINIYRQEVTSYLIHELGYEASIVNNASPRDIIKMYFEGENINLDIDSIICLINGAFNINLDTKE